MIKGFLNWVMGDKPRKSGAVGSARLLYDATLRTGLNAKHLSRVDAMGPRTATSKWTRTQILQWARMEYQNFAPISQGLEIKADAVLGTGPSLVPTTAATEATRNAIESRWAEWTETARLLKHMRAALIAMHRDGEAFLVNGMMATGAGHPLRVRVLETEQIADPMAATPTGQIDDGVTVDEFGQPTSYRILSGHPGEMDTLSTWKYQDFPAWRVAHLYRQDRAGQTRGVSWLAPALQAVAYIRRHGLATLGAAEKAASIAGVITSKSSGIPAFGVGADSLSEGQDASAFSEVQMSRDMFMMLPADCDINQLKAEHPASSHKEFTDLILREICMALGMPENLLIGNANGSFSSTRLDHLPFIRAVRILQGMVETEFLDPLFRLWYSYGTAIKGYFPDDAPPSMAPLWRWDGREPIDTREAGAVDTAVRNGTTHRKLQYELQGKNVDREDEQAAASYGVPVQEYRRRLFDTTFQTYGQGETSPPEDTSNA